MNLERSIGSRLGADWLRPRLVCRKSGLQRHLRAGAVRKMIEVTCTFRARAWYGDACRWHPLRAKHAALVSCSPNARAACGRRPRRGRSATAASPGRREISRNTMMLAMSTSSFPRIKRRRDLLPDHDDGVKVIRPCFGDELAKQPGRDAADCSQLLGIQQRPG